MTPMIKQIDKLSLEDLNASPYWMFYAGRQGEYDSFTTLIPETHPDYDPESVRLVRTLYTLANHVVASGYFYEDSNNPHQHVIFVTEQPFCLWSGVANPSAAHIAAFYAALNTEPNEVFPISWQSYGGKYAGVVAGFGCFDENHALSFQT